MSYYGNDKRTHIIDPIFKSNSRIEYRFPASSVVTNFLRVCDLKCTTGKPFNNLLGAKGLVKNIFLYDGGTTLDQQRNGKHYNGFINLVNSAGASAVGFVRDKHNGSRIASRTSYGAGATAGADCVKVATIQPNVNSESTSIWLNVQELLPICNSALGFDTDIMDNLRLVIEINEDKASVLQDSSGTAIDLSAFNPVLVCDELLVDADKQAVRESLKNLVWDTIEHDSFLLEEKASGSGVQTHSTRINGFNGKRLKRILIAKERDSVDGVDKSAGGTVDLGYGTAGSPCNYQEKLNVAVNGRNVFVDEGVDSKMKRVARTVDSWGQYHLRPNGNMVNAHTDLGDNDNVGKVDYLGIGIEEDRVTDLQIQLERNVPTDRDNKTGKQLTYHVYGEVAKGIMMEGSNYSVNYL